MLGENGKRIKNLDKINRKQTLESLNPLLQTVFRSKLLRGRVLACNLLKWMSAGIGKGQIKGPDRKFRAVCFFFW